MKRYDLLLSLALVVAGLAVVADGARLGTLTRDSLVFVPGDDISVVNGYPVFEIQLPAGYTEVQIRASLSNFEPGAILTKDGVQVMHYVLTGVDANGNNIYHGLGTNYDAIWNVENNQWEFGYDNLTSPYHATGIWTIPPNRMYASGEQVGNYGWTKEIFVYRTCTTGMPADDQWGVGIGDPDPWVYFCNQLTTNTFGGEFKRQKWDYNYSLTSQITEGFTLGSTIMFQPSRLNLGADGWLQQNQDRLIWVYQVEDVSGHPHQGDGSDVWNTMHPVEWRKNRITIP